MKYIGVFWTNQYIASIQHGIQSMHVTGKMSKNPNDSVAYEQWAQQQFLADVRNGGGHKQLKEFAEFLEEYAYNYTWQYFYESDEALNGSYTAVGIILPMDVFDPKFAPEYNDTSFEAEIYRKIKSTRHAI